MPTIHRKDAQELAASAMSSILDAHNVNHAFIGGFTVGTLRGDRPTGFNVELDINANGHIDIVLDNVEPRHILTWSLTLNLPPVSKFHSILSPPIHASLCKAPSFAPNLDDDESADEVDQ
ncbi:hypothetical protein TGAM01_v208817 [Trichoderma gamsii]|uniref:Uncharacterized protein n=1 Tax=Trichoderma gamsii TaxID=398673 RepID=A0A2P4ZDI2_9HYPO|nr:hypothetical protein TGAM01_v208817 [Trichoderma gamsii]PON22334.1 hypothetical protein TGAM01_v208817 [Trichoderma gamsii]